jgi:hypothetical protein
MPRRSDHDHYLTDDHFLARVHVQVFPCRLHCSDQVFLLTMHATPEWVTTPIPRRTAHPSPGHLCAIARQPPCHLALKASAAAQATSLSRKQRQEASPCHLTSLGLFLLWSTLPLRLHHKPLLPWCPSAPEVRRYGAPSRATIHCEGRPRCSTPRADAGLLQAIGCPAGAKSPCLPV